MTTSAPRRKKWSEAEERTLIDRYGDLISNGTLSKMKSREKKFRPIAFYVNSMHHLRDPLSFPWPWTWKDVSTKVQNMRHQYLLVKHKIKKPQLLPGGEEDFDWPHAISYWSNFLRYKEVFGDVPLVFGNNHHEDSMLGDNGSASRGVDMVHFGHPLTAGDEDGVLGLAFDYDGDPTFNNHCGKEDANDGFPYEEEEQQEQEEQEQEEEEEEEEEEVEGNAGSDLKRKKKPPKGFESFLANQLRQLREIETRFEHRELERDRERQKREHLRQEHAKERDKMWEERDKQRGKRDKIMDDLRKQRIMEREAMEKESQEREKRRREQVLIQEREWEERMNRRRCEWKTRMDDMLSQHREQMGQIQSRILHEQQNLTSQLLSIVSHWSGHPNGLPDHTGASSHYLSQMMQNLHHVNGMAHDDTRVEGDNQDDQFIVDG